MTIHHGDCLDVMATLDAESIDAIVTDPPYGLGFMGKAWDQLSEGPVEKSWDTKGRTMTTATRDPSASTPHGRSTTNTGYTTPNPRCGKCGRAINGRDTPKGFVVCHCDPPLYVATPNRQAQRSQAWHQQWAEAAYRVAKPSAYLLAFGGTRTVHRMTVALEDAGWIIRDMLVWAYATGFPKSKASLKPAWEPIVMARKPGPLRMLNIDECRIPGVPPSVPQPDFRSVNGRSTHLDANARLATCEHPEPARVFDSGGWSCSRCEQFIDPDNLGPSRVMSEASGRWPANVVLTDPIFDGDTPGVVGGGETSSGKMMPTEVRSGERTVFGSDAAAGYTTIETYGEFGTYSRFFLIPKADRADREPVLGGLPLRKPPGWSSGEQSPGTFQSQPTPPRANVHPTVKPTDLMRHLVRLVTPTGGVVLDPFLGSGTTALACELEGFPWVGIEREAEYVAIAEARLNGTQRGLGLGA